MRIRRKRTLMPPRDGQVGQWTLPSGVLVTATLRTSGRHRRLSLSALPTLTDDDRRYLVERVQPEVLATYKWIEYRWASPQRRKRNGGGT